MGKRHADHAAFGRGIGRLTNLPVIGGDAGGADQDTAFAGGFRFVFAHGFGGQADHVEAANQIDHDGLGVQAEVVGAVFADSFFSRGYPRAVDQAHQFAHGDGFGHHRLAIGFVAHITFDKRAAELLGNRFALVGLHVGNHHFAPVGRQHAGGAFAQARSATGDDENFALNVHVDLQNLIDVTSTSIMHIHRRKSALQPCSNEHHSSGLTA